MEEKRKCSVPPYQGDDPYVFFSYCHSDQNTAYPIIETLRGSGLRLWYDQGITAGADWPLYIAQKLQGAAVCLVAMSKAADESINCNRELAFAAEKRLNVVVVYLEECNVGLGTQLLIAGRQSCKAYQLSSEELVDWCKTSEEMKLCWGEPVLVHVEKKKPAVEISIQSWVYDGQFDSAKTLKISSDHTDAISPEILYYNAENGNQLREPPVHAGRYRIRGFWQTTQHYEEAEATAEFQIGKRPVSIRVPDAERPEGSYLGDFSPALIQGDINGTLQGIALTVECQESTASVGTYPGVLKLRSTAAQLEQQYPDYRFEIIPGTLRVTSEPSPVPPSGSFMTLIDMNSGIRMQTQAEQIRIGPDSSCEFVVEGAPKGIIRSVDHGVYFSSIDSGWAVDGELLPPEMRVPLSDCSVLSAAGIEIAVLTGETACTIKDKTTIFALKSINQGELKVLSDGEFPCGKAHNSLWKKDVMSVTDRTMTSIHHCDIVISGDHARVHDWKSTNGTLVNGVRYGARVNSQEWVDLKDGDTLRMGQQRFAFYQKKLREYTPPDTAENLLNTLREHRRKLEQYMEEYRSQGYARFDEDMEQWKNSIQDLSIRCQKGNQSVTSVRQLEEHTQQNIRNQITMLQQKLEESVARQRKAEQEWESLILNIRTQLQTSGKPQRNSQTEQAYRLYLTKGSLMLGLAAEALKKIEPYRETMNSDQHARLCDEEKDIAQIRELHHSRTASKSGREGDELLREITKILDSSNQPADHTQYTRADDFDDEATMLDVSCFGATTVLDRNEVTLDMKVQGVTLDMTVQEDNRLPMTVVVELNTGKKHLLQNIQVTIGSDVRACDIVLSKDEGIEKHHADLIFSKGCYYVHDNHSAGGVIVNGRKIDMDATVAMEGVVSLGLGAVELLAAGGEAASWINTQNTLFGLYSKEEKYTQVLSGATMSLGCDGLQTGPGIQDYGVIRLCGSGAELQINTGGTILLNGWEYQPGETVSLEHGDTITLDGRDFSFHRIPLENKSTHQKVRE